MSGLAVVPVRTRQDLRAFIDLPFDLYRQDPCWVAPLRGQQRRQLDQNRNPFFLDAEAAYFLVRRDGRPVGRISAHLDHRYNRFHSQPGTPDTTGFFGFFECEQDPVGVAALVDAAAAWLAEHSSTQMLGPASFTFLDEAGVAGRRLHLAADDADGLQPALLPGAAGGGRMHADPGAVRLAAGCLHPTAHRAGRCGPVGRGPLPVSSCRSAPSRPGAAAVPGGGQRRLRTALGPAPPHRGGGPPRRPTVATVLGSEPDAHRRAGRGAGRGGHDPPGRQRGAAQRPGAAGTDQHRSAPVEGQAATLARLPRIRPGGQAGPPSQRRGRHLCLDTLAAARRGGYRWGELGWTLASNDPINRAIRRLGGTITKTYRLYTHPVRPA